MAVVKTPGNGMFGSSWVVAVVVGLIAWCWVVNHLVGAGKIRLGACGGALAVGKLGLCAGGALGGSDLKLGSLD
jgi:hypothetical protein